MPVHCAILGLPFAERTQTDLESFCETCARPQRRKNRLPADISLNQTLVPLRDGRGCCLTYMLCSKRRRWEETSGSPAKTRFPGSGISIRVRDGHLWACRSLSVARWTLLASVWLENPRWYARQRKGMGSGLRVC
jgi:hypothetical protein